MKRKVFLLISLLLASTISLMITNAVHADPYGYVNVVPESAFVGIGRTIMVYINASDVAIGVFSVNVWAENIPNGVNIWFDPSIVYVTNSIQSTMYIYAGPAAVPGTYSTPVVVQWWVPWPGTPWTRTATLSLEVRAVNEGSWTTNPDLLQNQNWNPNVFMWNWAPPYQVWSNLPNEPDHHIYWVANGQVELEATDSHIEWYDSVGEACEFTQQPASVTVKPSITKLTLHAAVSNYGSNSPWSPWWTGIKFDAWATNTIDNRSLYIEMYFDRAGANLDWGIYYPENGYEAVRPLAADIDDYLVYVPESTFASQTTGERSVKIDTVDGVTYFTIDLSFFFERACRRWIEFDIYDTIENGVSHGWISTGKTVDDFSLTKIGLTLEASAALIDIGFPGPQTWATLRSMQVAGSYCPDVNLDGKVNVKDVYAVGQAYGANLGDPRYLPNADLNLDRKVDVKDYYIVCQYFGKTEFP